MTTDTLWGDISFVRRSENRKKVLEALAEPRTPTEVSEATSLDKGYISNILRGLEKRGLIECLTPDEVRHRLFKRTEKGNRILAELKKL